MQFYTAKMMRDVAHHLIFESMVDMVGQRSLIDSQLMAGVVDQLFLMTSSDLAKQQATMTCNHLSVLSGMGNSLDTLITVVNGLNGGALGGGEVALLVQSSNNASRGYSLGNGMVLLGDMPGCPQGPLSSNCSTLNDTLKSSTKVLAGLTDGFLGTSYIGDQAFIGYCPVPSSTLGVVYIIPFKQRQSSFLRTTVDAVWMANQTDWIGDLLVQSKYNPGVTLTGSFSPCMIDVCAYDPAGAAALQSPLQISVGLPSYDVPSSLAVAWEMPYLNASILMEQFMTDPMLSGIPSTSWSYHSVRSQILQQLALQSTRMNAELDGTSELLFVEKYMNGSSAQAKYLTAPKFTSQCAPNCETTASSRQAPLRAAVQCINETGLITDYRYVVTFSPS